VSGSKPRNTGQPARSQPRPVLRPVQPEAECSRPTLDPTLKAVQDDMRRRYAVQRERIESDADAEAA
jgi:hypothetical protein